MPRTTIRSEDITDLQVKTTDIAASNVTTAKMATDPTNASNLSSGSVPLAQLGNVPSQTALLNDIATLALHSAVQNNQSAFNLTNAFIDQYEDSSGLDVLTQCLRDSAEYVSSNTEVDGTPAYDSGDRLSTITVTTDGTTQRSVTTIVDGSTSAGDSFYWNPSQSGIYLRFQFATTKKITGVRFTNDESGTANNGTWQWQGSDNGSSWTNIGSTFAYTNTTMVGGAGGYTVLGDTLSGNTTSYLYYQMINTAGSTVNNSNWMEIIFLITPVTGQLNATGNYTSTTETALATVSKESIVVLYKNESGTATLDTDLVAEVSANGGTNYTAAPLTAAGTFSTGILTAKSDDITISNTGTAPKYKISFANQSDGSKVTRVYGVALMY